MAEAAIDADTRIMTERSYVRNDRFSGYFTRDCRAVDGLVAGLAKIGGLPESGVAAPEGAAGSDVSMRVAAPAELRVHPASFGAPATGSEVGVGVRVHVGPLDGLATGAVAPRAVALATQAHRTG